MSLNLSAEEKAVLDTFDDIAATILVLQRDGFTCRARESLMENFTRHITLYFGGIICADGHLSPEELSFFNYVVRHSFSETEFHKKMYRYMGEKDLFYYVQWVPEYIDTLIQFDGFRNTHVVSDLLLALETLGQLFHGIDGKSHENDYMARHLQTLGNYIKNHKPLATEHSLEKSNREKSPLKPLKSQGEPTYLKSQPVVSNQPSIQKSKSVEKYLKPKPLIQTQSEDAEKLIAEIKALVGINEVKQEVDNLVNLIRVSQMRKTQGLPVPPLTLHLIFTGNPGTGKTTIARKLAQIYQALGILTQGHLIEVDRGGLVAGYAGQTAIKTKEVIQSALGGILFIDEAYALVPAADRGGDQFGQEAVDTLLKAMEDYREDFIVVVAGYPQEMTRFIESNPGLKSRFKRTMNFADYKGNELYAIFELMLKNAAMQLTEAAASFAQKAFDLLYECRGKDFGNGRMVRNLFEHALTFQANRLVETGATEKEDLILLTETDILAAVHLIDENISDSLQQASAQALEINNIFEEINALVGLEKIKTQVNIWYEQKSYLPLFPSFCFGEPGCGKKTVIRKLTRIYHHLGLLEKGQMIEVNWQGLVGDSAEHSQNKTSWIIEKSIGGTLFIDEAHELFLRPGDEREPFAVQAALQGLAKYIHSQPQNTWVVFGGQDFDLIQSFSDLGLDLSSAQKFYFEPFSEEELSQILISLFKQAKRHINLESEIFIKKAFERLSKERKLYGLNGNKVKNIFDAALSFQAERLKAALGLDHELMLSIDIRDLMAGFKCII